jgi:cytochrome c-type biogenesis protein CcsB
MDTISVYFFWAGLAAAAVASASYLVYVFGSRVVMRQAATSAGTLTVATTSSMPRTLGQSGTLFTWLAVALLGLSLGARTIATGHPPYTNMYEFTVAFGWGISLFYALFERRYRQRTLGAVIMPVALALLLISGIFFPSEIIPLQPALQANTILAIHVGMMALSYAALSISFGTALLFLVQGEQRRFSRLPSQELLEEIGYRSVLVGFPMLALGIALGAYWGNSAWGRWWGWDPKETSALVTWLIYAGYLHARSLGGWRGTRSAMILIIGFIAVLFTYFVVNLWVAGLHSYAGV